MDLIVSIVSIAINSIPTTNNADQVGINIIYNSQCIHPRYHITTTSTWITVYITNVYLSTPILCMVYELYINQHQ